MDEKDETLEPQRARMKYDGAKKRDALLKANLQLQMNGWFLGPGAAHKPLEVSPQTGVHELLLDLSACERLHQVLTKQKYRDEWGILSYKNLKMPGFEYYNFTEAERHHTKRQQQYVSMLYGEVLASALRKWPSFTRVVQGACAALGVTLAALHHAHFIVQFSPLAIFSWHNDAQDLCLTQRAVSVIVPLNDAPSGVELFGFDMHQYRGTGAAVAFPSVARHRSVALRPVRDTKEGILAVDTHTLQSHPVKVALFFK